MDKKDIVVVVPIYLPALSEMEAVSLNESAFAEFTEYFIYQLAFTHGVVNFHFQFFAGL